MIILEIIAYIVGFTLGSSLFFYFLNKKEERRKKIGKENIYIQFQKIRGERENKIDD